MNREILFKAKRKDNGEWVEGYYAIAEDSRGLKQHHIFVPDRKHGYFEWVVIDKKTLCQYIGRTTEQGKAWEHDLIRLQSGEICEIVYDRNECAWCAASIEDATKYILLKYALATEYIGSKFDRLELIGGAS